MILDLFAGPGGWDQGLRLLDHKGEVIGIEIDKAACLTRAAAGHLSIRADIAKFPSRQFRGHVTGLIASPPCTDFSAAGQRAGLAGKSGNLVFQVLRWATELEPEWIACEQVPAVLPFWKDFAHQLTQHGYRTWTGILNAADFGVPQTRKRAILMASKRPFVAPVPTHAQRPEAADLFGDPIKPWVTMAQALGWTEALAIRTRGERDPSTGGNVFSSDEPSWAITSKTRSWNFDDQQAAKIMLHGGGWSMHNRMYDPALEPAPTIMFGKDAAGWNWQLNAGRDWPENGDRADAQVITGDRPAPALTSQVKSWLWQDPTRVDEAGSARVTVAEAGVLQSFPWDYPWQGSNTKQYEQVGNAIPCLLAAAVVKQLL